MFLVDMTGFLIGLILLMLLVVCVTIFVVAMWKEYHNEYFSVKDLVDDTADVLKRAWGAIGSLFGKKKRTAQKKSRRTPVSAGTQKAELPAEGESSRNLGKIYGPKAFFSEDEAIRLQKLQKYAESKQLHIFPRVRLADLMLCRIDPKENKKLHTMLITKCADYVVCDRQYRVKCVILLKDPAGKNGNINRFISDALSACGYRVLITERVTAAELANAMK